MIKKDQYALLIFSEKNGKVSAHGWNERTHSNFSKNNSQANEAAISAVRTDKEREARDGHDGTWVAHPGLVPVAMEVFDRLMPEPNQIDKDLSDTPISATDLLKSPSGPITERGVRQNVAVALGYLEGWLRGIGCVPLFNLMEDTATAEISRAQLWQWVHHHGVMDDGREVTLGLCESYIGEELEKTKARVDEERYSAYARAAELVYKLTASSTFVDFLTLPAYDQVI